MKIPIRKHLIIEGTEEKKLMMQNFLNGTDPKQNAAEQFQIASLNAGVVPGDVKMNLIQMNHKNRLVGHHTLDRGHDGIDTSDLKQNLYAQKAL